MKIVVLGGTRYMGRAAAMKLAAAGHEVVTVSRSPVEVGLSHRLCDRKNHEALLSLVHEEAPEAILDMVCFDANDGAGMCQLFNSGFLPSLRHYLMVSTFFIYNHFSGREENFIGDHMNVKDGYTRRKIEAEIHLQASPLFDKSSIVRLPFVFSHDDYSGRFQRFCSMVQDGRIASASVPAWKTSMIAMNDAADALTVILQGPPLGWVDASNFGCLSLEEIGEVIAFALGASHTCLGGEDPSVIYPLTRDLCLGSAKSPRLRPLEEALTAEAKLWDTHNRSLRGGESRS